MKFDIYHPSDAVEFRESLTVGAAIELDGIDGFFDQYFEDREPGELIRFVPIYVPQPFSFVPTEASAFDSLPVIEAVIESCNSISGTVIPRSIESFISWIKRLPVDALSDEERRDEIDHLLGMIPQFKQHEPFYWNRTPEEITRSNTSGVNALLGFPQESGFRIAALTSNMFPSVVVYRDTTAN
jgi:hypothetical protein